MVTRKYFNFYTIIFIINLQIHPKDYDKEYGVLGMVKIKFLEVELQNLTEFRTRVEKG